TPAPPSAASVNSIRSRGPSSGGSSSLLSSESSSSKAASMPRSRAYMSESATGTGSGSSRFSTQKLRPAPPPGVAPLLSALLVAVGVDDGHLAGVAGCLGGVPLIHPVAVGRVEPESVRLVLLGTQATHVRDPDSGRITEGHGGDRAGAIGDEGVLATG